MADDTLRASVSVLAKIADAYDASELDEARPEWNSDSDPTQVVLLAGRGGKTLLTLGDCFDAREALRAPEPMFPIMGGPKIPWSLIAPYEDQALRNHSQSLKRLAERGGLSMCEAMAVMSSASWEKRPIAKPTVQDWLDFIAERKARDAQRSTNQKY